MEPLSPVILLWRAMQARRSRYHQLARRSAGYGLGGGKIKQKARLKECFYFHPRRYVVFVFCRRNKIKLPLCPRLFH